METVEFIGWVCLAAFVGFWWGSKVTAAIHRAAAHMLLEELKITPQQLKKIQEDLEHRISTIDEGEEDKEIIDVRLEQHQGVIFAYRCDDGLFLGQGTSQDEIIKSVSARLINCTVRIAADQGADLLQKNNRQNG